MLFRLVLASVASFQNQPPNKAPTTLHALNSRSSIEGWQKYLRRMDSVIAFHLNGYAMLIPIT